MLSSGMLDWNLLGFDFYHILNWFWIYSFIGWIWESSFVSLKSHKAVNRGFVSGPVLTIYGCGAVSVYLLLKPFDHSFIALYFGGALVATVLEYVTGTLMEAIFHTNWWDYSDKKFNFRGRICLGSSIGWGFFTLVLFYVFQPFVDWIVSLYPRNYGEAAINLITMVYCVDFGMSSIVAFQIKDKLANLDKTWDEFLEYLQKSRLAESAAAMKKKTAALYHETSAERILNYFEERKEHISEYLDKFLEESSDKKESLLERKDEYMERFDKFINTLAKNQKSLDRITKRYIKAYPHLGLGKRFKRREEKEDVTSK